MSNQDVAKKFYTEYLKIFDIEEDDKNGKVYMIFDKANDEHITGPFTLATYLMHKTTVTSVRDDIFKVITSALLSNAKIGPVLADFFKSPVLEEMKKTGDIDVLEQLKSEDGAAIAAENLDKLFKGGIYKPSDNGPEIDQDKMIELIVDEIFDFSSHTIIKFAQETINKYIKDAKEYLKDKDAEHYHKIEKSLTYIQNIKAQQDAVITKLLENPSDQRVAQLEEAAFEFIENYITKDSIVNVAIASIGKLIQERILSASSELNLWKAEGAVAFRQLYDGESTSGINGGLLDSFRQTYSSAQWVVQWGYGEGAAEYLEDVKRHRLEWDEDFSDQCKMDIWNDQVGRAIGFSVLRELEKNYKTLDEINSASYIQAANEMIAERTKVAVDLGIIARSNQDPRLELLDNPIWSGKVSDVQGYVKAIFDSVQGGLLFEAKGNSLIQFIENNVGRTDIEKDPDWTKILDHVLKHTHQGISQNNVSNPGWSQISDEQAHKLLQLVQWAKHGRATVGACDPANDPDPENPDDLDHALGNVSYRSIANMTGDPNSLSGGVFIDDGKYYLVFNDIPGYEAAWGANPKQDIKAFADRFLNQAYAIYRTFINEYGGLQPHQVTLLGHGTGGAIAGALSTALFYGAFTEDMVNTETGATRYGKFDAALAHYGWSLDADGEVVDNR